VLGRWSCLSWEGVVFFFVLFCLGGQVFGGFFAPSPEEETSDYLAQGWFIRVLTVIVELSRAAGLWTQSVSPKVR